MKPSEAKKRAVALASNCPDLFCCRLLWEADDFIFCNKPASLARIASLAPVSGDPEDPPDSTGWHRRVLRSSAGFMLLRQRPHSRYFGMLSEVTFVPTLDADAPRPNDAPPGTLLGDALNGTALSLRQMSALGAALETLGVPVASVSTLAEIARAVDTWVCGTPAAQSSGTSLRQPPPSYGLRGGMFGGDGNHATEEDQTWGGRPNPGGRYWRNKPATAHRVPPLPEWRQEELKARAARQAEEARAARQAEEARAARQAEEARAARQARVCEIIAQYAGDGPRARHGQGL